MNGLGKQRFLKWYVCKRTQKRSKERRLSPSAGDSSSIADVAFLLLIFFIVTSSFLLPQGLFLKLPSNSAKATKVKKKYIIDLYPQNDNYLIDKKKYDGPTLTRFLQNRIKQIPETILVIHMKKEILYRRFIDTLNVARKSKLRRISLKEESND